MICGRKLFKLFLLNLQYYMEKKCNSNNINYQSAILSIMIVLISYIIAGIFMEITDLL